MTIHRDSRGLPIRAGDLLRTYHFRPRNRQLPTQYLYHVVVENGGALEAVPLREAIGAKPSGGRFWITKDLMNTEIIHGESEYDETGSLRMWCERERQQKGGAE